MEPGYSDIYATRASADNELHSDEKELLMATLVIGSCIELDRDCCKQKQGKQCCVDMNAFCREIIAPPAKAACSSTVKKHPVDGVDVCTQVPHGAVNAGAKYNTVRGYTQTDTKIETAGADATAKDQWMKNPDCPVSQVTHPPPPIHFVFN